MNTRLAGALWTGPALSAPASCPFVLIGEPIDDLGFLLVDLALPARVLGGVCVGFQVGGPLVTRPRPNVILVQARRHRLALAFGPLVVTAVTGALGGDEVCPVVSSSLITGGGIASAVVGHLSGTTRVLGR